MATDPADDRGPAAVRAEQRARELLTPGVYDYIAGGARSETTLREAESAWWRWRLRPRVLTGVEQVDLRTTLLGTAVASPIGLAPWALQRMAHPDGELAVARAAQDRGALMTVSTSASVDLREIATGTPQGPKWLQLYRVHSAAYTDDLVRRAAEAGYSALVVTADLPVLGRRLRDEVNAFALPPGVELANRPDPALGPGAPGGSGVSVRRDDSRSAVTSGPVLEPWTYRTIEHLAGRSDLPVVVKGVLRGDDAVRCARAGAAAVWVSTHGGRQLDRAVPSAVALPEVVAAAGAEVEVYVDGGIRSGTDALVALALGARAVFLGRPVAWALATGGETGVAGLLGELDEELAHTMVLCGIDSTAGIAPDLLLPMP